MKNIPEKSRKIRLGYFIYGRGLGGNGRYLMNLIERLDHSKYDVTVYIHCQPCSDRDEFEKRLRELGAKIQRLNSEGLPETGQEAPGVSQAVSKPTPQKLSLIEAVKVNWYYLKLAKKITHFFNSQNLDVLHFSLGGFPTLMHVVAGALDSSIKRLVMIVHIMEYDRRRLIDRLLIKKIVKSNIPVIALSQMMKKELHQRFAFPLKNITVVYNGVDTHFYSPAARSSNGGLKKVLIPARLHKVKGHEYLFQAIASKKERFKNTQFLLAGEGSDRKELEKRAEELGLKNQIQFLGFRSDLKELMQDSDVVALSSLNEGFPFVLLEAMACEKPVVSTDAGAVEEMIEEGITGYVTKRKDTAALAEALLKVLEAAPEDAKKMGKSGRARVIESFSIEQMVRHTVALYD